MGREFQTEAAAYAKFLSEWGEAWQGLSVSKEAIVSGVEVGGRVRSLEVSWRAMI